MDDPKSIEASEVSAQRCTPGHLAKRWLESYIVTANSLPPLVKGGNGNDSVTRWPVCNASRTVHLNILLYLWKANSTRAKAQEHTASRNPGQANLRRLSRKH